MKASGDRLVMGISRILRFFLIASTFSLASETFAEGLSYPYIQINPSADSRVEAEDLAEDLEFRFSNASSICERGRAPEIISLGDLPDILFQCKVDLSNLEVRKRAAVFFKRKYCTKSRSAFDPFLPDSMELMCNDYLSSEFIPSAEGSIRLLLTTISELEGALEERARACFLRIRGKCGND